MGKVAISLISLDMAGRLRLYLRASEIDYAFIWRDATSVRWDSLDRSLYVLPVDGFTLVDEIYQIAKAVKNEYGDSLVIDAATVFSVPPETERLLRLSNLEVNQ